ncbi:flagellar motor protein MotB [Halobacteriovorax sp. YZS-1-1]|uniref:OmpA/MotB family protein n=1 Tax=unclassified Halobacteriovorax TaxID=2639665 RepID=UPI0039998BB3
MAIKKKAPQQGGGDDEGGWLVSYADMMTLIACFFILMMAFANYDPVGFNKKANELSKSFQKGKYKTSEVKLNEIWEEISKHPELDKNSKISIVDNQLVISFSSSILFEEGSVELSSSSIESLDTMIDIIRTKNPNYRIIIEGHTDSKEESRTQGINGPWQIGAIRAAKVLSRFEYYGFGPKTLLAITKGDSEPLLSEEDFEAKKKKNPNAWNPNRRVMIKVVEPKDPKSKIKFGFGIYFNDKK